MSRICTWLFVLLAMAVRVSAGPVDAVSRMVVHLSHEKQKYVEIDGIRHELGIREPGQGAFRPLKELQSGTGLFVADERMRLFIVTARHVARDMPPLARATFMGKAGSPISHSLGELANGAFTEWKEHPRLDLAVLELRPTETIQIELAGHFLPISGLGISDPSRDVPLLVIGFPLGFGVRDSYSPISRETKLASNRITTAAGDVFLLLQDPSVSGYSGAPVFDLGLPISGPGGIAIREAKVQCIGFVSATFSDETGGKFAKIIPASVVAELLR